jgi:tripartite-type tricarboxylate transporter receptor subunit TctC
VRSGRLKAYAIIGRKRFAGLPDLPTMGELGYKKLEIARFGGDEGAAIGKPCHR